jgi:hypothetical protein
MLYLIEHRPDLALLEEPEQRYAQIDIYVTKVRIDRSPSESLTPLFGTAAKAQSHVDSRTAEDEEIARLEARIAEIKTRTGPASSAASG